MNTTAIIEELINPTFKEIIVAEGLPVIPARDGFIKQYFSSTISEVLEEVRGVVDFKNRIKIPVVEAGDVIAEIFSPREGMPGFDVFGQNLDPKTPKKINVRSKPRVKITGEGQVIALFSGRPSITGNSIKQFDVLEAYEVFGDVDMSTGNILFNGDVIIRGHIKDNMKVECAGSIFVYGNVYYSVLIASQNINIYGNIINSKINGGQFSLYYSEIYKIIQNLSSGLKRLIGALNQLKNAIKAEEFESRIGFVIATLVENKFKTITENVNEYSRIINDLKNNKYQLPLHFKLVMNTLMKFKNYQSLQSIDSVGFIQSVKFALNDLIQKMEGEIMEESDIVFHSANQSQIKTNGRIIINKEGIVNTTLFAGTEIIFKNKNSVIRGGKVEAVQKITAGIVGSSRGKSPILYAGKEITANELHHAEITMQNQKLIIGEKVINLVLKYNEEKEKVESNIALKSFW
ncbi:FapA family protein [Bacillaceae bacterium IKA-2]|nr:FapA family protein [Bacillaceae bacterium IKA-2]